MKKSLRYIITFAWAVLFLYYFNIYMPKNIWYFIIGIPALGISSYFIFHLLEFKSKKQNS